MSLRYALLGVLEARPMTGYELAQFFDQSTRWVWNAPHSNIYPELRKMEEEGLISGRKEIRGQRLERKLYSITEEGIEQLRQWVVTSPNGANQRDPMFLRAVFFDLVEPEDAVPLLENYIAELDTSIEEWSGHRALLLAKDTPLLRERLTHRPQGQHERIAQLKAHVFEGMMAVAEARRVWAQETLELIGQGARRRVTAGRTTSRTS
jgi:DNA-binding PadR family transcriptional regulator